MTRFTLATFVAAMLIPSAAMAQAGQNMVPVPAPAPSPQDPLGTGNAFAEKCAPALRGEGAGEVFGISMGFIDGVIYKDAYPPPHFICVPRGTTRMDVMEMVFDEIRRDTDLADMDGNGAVILALSKAFPSRDTPRSECAHPLG